MSRGDGTNWYIYANNNPLRFIDPTGLYTVTQRYSDDSYEFTTHTSDFDKYKNVVTSLMKPIGGDNFNLYITNNIADKLMPSSFYRTVHDSTVPSLNETIADTAADLGAGLVSKIKGLGKGIQSVINWGSKGLGAKDVFDGLTQNSQREESLEDFLEISGYNSKSLLEGITNDDDALSIVDAFVNGVDDFEKSDYAKSNDKEAYATEILIPKIESIRTSNNEDLSK